SKRRTSNDAVCLTTVSNTTMRICESIRWPSASTTSLNAEALAMSREDGQRQGRLNVEIALGDFSQRSIEHRFRALLERRDKRQAILPEFRQLQHAVDVDAVL